MPELDQTIAQHFGIDKIKDTRAANILLIEGSWLVLTLKTQNFQKLNLASYI